MVKYFQNNTSFYAQAAVLNVFLFVIADGSRWQYRLLDIIDNNSNIQIEKMGFFKNWHKDPFWRITAKSIVPIIALKRIQLKLLSLRKNLRAK